MAVKAGSPELRKCLRRYRGFTLRSTSSSHAELLDPDGKPVRYVDGRKVVIVCSPRNGTDEAKSLIRKLEALGIFPTRRAA